MKLTICILITIIIILSITIIILSDYNLLKTYKIKMDLAEDSIKKGLNEKYDIMKDIENIICKHLKKKEYLKDFNELKPNETSFNELDSVLDESLQIMIALKDDHKSLNISELDEKINNIKRIDEIIESNKVFFNKNNDELLRKLKGFRKITAKFMSISNKNSYEIKEPME